MKFIAVLFTFALTLNIGQSQIQIPLFSEPASLEQQIGNTHFRIEYEKPKKNDRIIFGALVPFGQVWRTGSSACTKLFFDNYVTIEGQNIPAGCYSLFTIPEKDNWTIILNRDTSLYGAYDYDSKKDAIRFEVEPTTSSEWFESFNINIDVNHDEGIVYLSWENLSVSFGIKTNTYDVLLSQVEDILINDYELEEGTYTHVADYIIHNRSGFGAEFITIVERLIEKSFEMHGESSYSFRCKRDILKLKKNKVEYVKVSKDHIDYLLRAKPYQGYEIDVEVIRKEIKAWK